MSIRPASPKPLLWMVLAASGCLMARADDVAALGMPEASGPSLAEAVWTSFITRTNGRDMRLWAQYTHPQGWPTSAAPVMVWNPKGLLSAYRNHTAISQCWEGEGSRGQVPMTLLTRRHAYTRGHHTGAPADGKAHLSSSRNGQKVWFVTAKNEVVEVRIANWLTRLGRESQENRNPNPGRGQAGFFDYSLVIFDRDLPPAILPLKVMRREDCQRLILSDTNWPSVVLKTEQLGHVSAGLPPFQYNTWKGGDSGSPDMVPMDDWLVFIGGRSTSGPSEQMQADIDTLTRSMKLDPRRYQLDWILSSEF